RLIGVASGSRIQLQISKSPSELRLTCWLCHGMMTVYVVIAWATMEIVEVQSSQRGLWNQSIEIAGLTGRQYEENSSGVAALRLLLVELSTGVQVIEIHDR